MCGTCFPCEWHAVFTHIVLCCAARKKTERWLPSFGCNGRHIFFEYKQHSTPTQHNTECAELLKRIFAGFSFIDKRDTLNWFTARSCSSNKNMAQSSAKVKWRKLWALAANNRFQFQKINHQFDIRFVHFNDSMADFMPLPSFQFKVASADGWKCQWT